MFEGCLIGDYDGEGGVHLGEKCIKARKPHRCIECRSEIPKGAHYWHASGINTGEGYWHVRTCETCYRVRKSLVRGSFEYGTLWMLVDETYCHDREDREAMLPESYVRPTARIATVPGRTALIIPGNVGKAILPGNVEP